MIKSIFLFSGQGSHYYQMGKFLYDNNKTFGYWMNKMDEFIQYEFGFSVVAELYSPQNRKSRLFDRLVYTHPAIFMVELSLAMALKENSISEDIVVGSSLGEFTGLVVTNQYQFDEMLYVIVSSALMIEKYCTHGAMLAVLGNINELRYIVESTNLEVASFNNNNNFIVSGVENEILFFEQELDRLELCYQRLAINYPFHSSAIDCIKKRFVQLSSTLSNRLCTDINIVSCTKPGFVHDLNSKYFWDVIRNPIFVEDTISCITNISDYILIDLSPGGTFLNLLKQSNIEINKSYQVLSPMQDTDSHFKDLLAVIK